MVYSNVWIVPYLLAVTFCPSKFVIAQRCAISHLPSAGETIPRSAFEVVYGYLVYRIGIEVMNRECVHIALDVSGLVFFLVGTLGE